jgi:hypothetical protein
MGKNVRLKPANSSQKLTRPSRSPIILPVILGNQ